MELRGLTCCKMQNFFSLSLLMGRNFVSDIGVYRESRERASGLVLAFSEFQKPKLISLRVCYRCMLSVNHGRRAKKFGNVHEYIDIFVLAIF